MSKLRDDRAYWDQRYREGAESWREPDPFLVEAYEECIHPLFPQPGRALDVAGGMGRHATWLAQRGWDVTLVDISKVGLERAAAHKASKGSIELIAADLEHYKLPLRQYDLVLVFFYLQRSLFPALKAALKPGGLLGYKTYTLGHRQYGRGPHHPMYFLKPNELLRAFSSMRILHYRETVKEKGVAELVARRRL